MTDSPEENGSAARVLIVDDVEALRALIGFTLRMTDQLVEVGQAGDGQEAIEAARKHQPDLILLDLSMPGMDGLEALPALLREAPGTRVVVFSGYAEAAMAAKAMAAGAVGYLEKGLGPDVLIERLEAIWAEAAPHPAASNDGDASTTARTKPASTNEHRH